LPGTAETAADQVRRKWREARRSDGSFPGRPLFEVITDAVAEHGADLQVYVGGDGHRRQFTFRELYDQSLSLATSLRDLGVNSESAVAVQSAHTPEAMIAYLATCAVGATLVPIPSIYLEHETGFIIGDSRARVLITIDRWRNNDYLAAIPRYLASTSLEHVIVIGESTHSYLPFADLLNRPALATPALQAPSTEHRAMIIYTSGSTSNPKGVVHSDDTTYCEVHQNYRPARLAGSSWLNAAPAGHMGGMLCALKLMFFGRPGVWVENWDAEVALALIREFSLTAATLVPYHIMTLIEAMDRAGIDTLDLRDVQCGSTMVPVELMERADRMGIRAYRAYGSTEHPTISKAQPSDDLGLRSRTDGPVLPGVEVRIVDEAGRDVPDGEIGQILSRGTDQFLGYTDADANAAAFTADGWFRTGDLGRLDNSILTVTGRLKEVIIRGGENISVREVEEMLMLHPDVLEAVVAPKPHPRYGEQVWAFLRTRDNVEVSLDDIRDHFRRNGVARQKTPEGVTVMADFPRTAIGKVVKRELIARLGP
jgi:acyl-CoA synthetase (AMP-forming)/AMP-acid ligase II